jgi:hypothetical protein
MKQAIHGASTLVEGGSGCLRTGGGGLDASDETEAEGAAVAVEASDETEAVGAAVVVEAALDASGAL